MVQGPLQVRLGIHFRSLLYVIHSALPAPATHRAPQEHPAHTTWHDNKTDKQQRREYSRSRRGVVSICQSIGATAMMLNSASARRCILGSSTRTRTSVTVAVAPAATRTRGSITEAPRSSSYDYNSFPPSQLKSPPLLHRPISSLPTASTALSIPRTLTRLARPISPLTLHTRSFSSTVRNMASATSFYDFKPLDSTLPTEFTLLALILCLSYLVLI